MRGREAVGQCRLGTRGTVEIGDALLRIGRVSPAIALIVMLLSLVTAPAHAQLSPDADWQTIRTEHFRVHFVPELELIARRAAASAETAYVKLARELVPPRGTVDIVVSDDADFTNGWATPFPTNRIVIYSHPPSEGQTLRYYHDWVTLVITHELTHIFQLDRTRGWWRVAQWVFGRNPFLFPNQYQPRWMTEGLAVYYESHLTGFGRLAGSEHRALATASILAETTPRLDELSLATPRFPGGQAAYAFGSLLFEHLAETRGPESVAEFVERASGVPIPYFLERPARRSFGISLTDAWREWRDSLRADRVAAGPPLPAWRELTRDGRWALYPRWLDDTTLVYAASTGRESPGAYAVTLNGATRRLGRRNGLDANVPLPGGGIVFAQPEYVSPYVVRSDLYVQHGDEVRRLTSGARLAYPDARADGEIVAMRAGHGTTDLARVSTEGRVTLLTTAHPDTQWSAPRWSPDGTRLVAIRWLRGAMSEVIVLDTLGAVQRVLVREQAVLGTPAWSPDGAAVVYSSDREGVSDLYIVAVEDRGAPPGGDRGASSGSGARAAGVTASFDVLVAPAQGDTTTSGIATRAPVRLSDARTAMLDPAPSRDMTRIAAVHFRADGYHIGVGMLPDRRSADSASVARSTRDSLAAPLPTAASHDGPASSYSPWRSLIPRYWLPTLLDVTDERVLIGALTGSSDLVDRHSYTAQVMGATNGERYSAELYWRYAGLGQPVIDVGLVRLQDPALVLSGGEYTETEDRVQISLGVSRPRYRSFAFAQLGAEVERYTSRTDPASLLGELGIPRTSYRNGIFVSSGWSNTQRPALSISPEDGISVSAFAQHRWTSGTAARSSNTIIGSLSGYKSLDLPGFAHHVLAARVAAAYTDQETFSRYSVGGTSGSAVSIAPGVSLGDPRRRFGVRGFPVVDSIDVNGTARLWRGIHAVGWTAEYRAPLLLPARGYRLLPVFFDRSSISVFTEGATAWCPAPESTPAACPAGGIPREWIASAGAELALDAAVLSYDFPYRFRVGVAVPYLGREHATSSVSIYVTMGLAF